jgi:hypothetical protein
MSFPLHGLISWWLWPFLAILRANRFSMLFNVGFLLISSRFRNASMVRISPLRNKDETSVWVQRRRIWRQAASTVSLHLGLVLGSWWYMIVCNDLGAIMSLTYGVALMTMLSWMWFGDLGTGDDRANIRFLLVYTLTLGSAVHMGLLFPSRDQQIRLPIALMPVCVTAAFKLRILLGYGGVPMSVVLSTLRAPLTPPLFLSVVLQAFDAEQWPWHLPPFLIDTQGRNASSTSLYGDGFLLVLVCATSVVTNWMYIPLLLIFGGETYPTNYLELLLPILAFTLSTMSFTQWWLFRTLQLTTGITVNLNRVQAY